MTVEEAVHACDFWTENLAGTIAHGSTTDAEVAAAFNATVSTPRQRWSDPDGPRNYEVRVPARITDLDAETGLAKRDEHGQPATKTNPVYLLILQEIDLRQKAVTA